MVTNEKRASTISWMPDAIYGRPWLGLVAVGTLLSFQMFGHSFTMIQREFLDHSQILVMDYIVGAFGMYCVWRGFGKDELTQTCYGAVGGALIWFGWFESTFELIADGLLGEVEKLTWNGMPYYGGGIQLLEWSGLLLVPILMLLGLNKDTRCRFFKWFHRNLNLKPEAPTVGYRRQYSRITAMEYIFITWFIYIVDLIMLDPRLIGPDRMVALSIVFLSYCGWCVYLTYKLTEQSGPAPTIRYAIGAGIVIWLIPETLAATQIIEEFYLKPFEFPILMSCITAYMVISFYALANATDRGALPKKKRDRKPPSQEAAPVEAQT